MFIMPSLTSNRRSSDGLFDVLGRELLILICTIETDYVILGRCV